jgi:hypothetical protein
MAGTRNENSDVTLHVAVKWLLREFNMKTDDDGVCIGMTNSALVAALAPRQSVATDERRFIGDLETFINRLAFIMKLYDKQEDVPKRVQEIKEKVKLKNTITDEEKMYLEIPIFLQRVDAKKRLMHKKWRRYCFWRNQNLLFQSN